MLAVKPLWSKEKRTVKARLTLPSADAPTPIETSRSRPRGAVWVVGIRPVNKLTNLRGEGTPGAPRAVAAAVAGAGAGTGDGGL